MLFTNTHPDYHRPQDDWELINQRGLERVAAFAGDLVGEIAGSEDTEVVALSLVEGAKEFVIPEGIRVTHALKLLAELA